MEIDEAMSNPAIRRILWLLAITLFALIIIGYALKGNVHYMTMSKPGERIYETKVNCVVDSSIDFSWLAVLHSCN